MGPSSLKTALGAGDVKLPSDGTRLANYVGSQSITWNQAHSQNWFDLGYPFDAPFNGEWMYYCQLPTVKIANDTNTGPGRVLR